MPTTFAALDRNLPRFTGQESLEAKVKQLQDYQYQLLEQLRYALNNLDLRNMNQTAVADWTEGITQPIHARIEDDEGYLNQLAVTAQGMQAQISDASGNITALQAVAQGLQTQVTSMSGDVSVLQQTASSLTTRISSSEGSISSLQQTASSLQSLISNNAGSISALQQTVDSFTLTVANSSEYSTIKLWKDGVAIASKQIYFSGMVLFSDLETEGATAIHGGNIMTDTLYLDTLYGDYIFLMDSDGYPAARFAITGSSSYTGGALDILTGALRMQAFGGDIYMAAADGGAVQVSEGVQITGNMIPNSANKYTCGSYGFPWSNIYSTDGTISSSDRNQKFDIDYDLSWTDDLFDGLKPSSFRRTVGDNYRRHTGLIAQDVKAIRDKLEIPDSELAAYCEWTMEDGSTGCGLRYEEFIGILIYQVQELKKRVKTLEGETA